MRFFWSGLVVSLLVLGTACQREHEQSRVPSSKRTAEQPARQELQIGVVAPYEGPNAHIGPMIMNAVKLFFDHNRFDGVEIKLVPIDTRSSPPDAVAALQATVADPRFVALIAFYHSSTALASKPIIQEAKLPTLIYSASNPEVTKDAPYYFRLVPTDDNQAIVLGEYAKYLGARKVAVLYYADDYGKGLADGIQAVAKSRELNVASVQSYDATTTDFRPMLTVIKEKKPDVIFICGFVEKSIAILNQAAEMNLKVKFLAGDGTFNEEQLVQGAGANAEGVYVAAPYVFDELNSKNKEFLDAYFAAYEKGGPRRRPPSWSAFAYDAASILGKALASGHRQRATIHEFLRTMNSEASGYQGITGLIYFGPDGNAVGRNFKLAVLRGGQFVAAR